MEEVWKDVCGYEGVYEVSSMGRVKRIARAPGATPGRVLKPYIMVGYEYVSLCPGNGAPHRTTRLHRVVAQAFLGEPPDDKPEVNHRNCNPVDNRVDNLEWVSRAENMKHAHRHGRCHPVPPVLRGEQNGYSKLTEAGVRQIRHLYASGSHNHTELGTMFGVHKGTIRKVVIHQTWAHVT